MSIAAAARGQTHLLPIRNAWPSLLGFATLALPTAISLIHREWTRDFGAHEPIVLAVSAWLFWRQWPQVRTFARLGRPAPTIVLLLFALPSYVFGRAYDFLTFETAGLYGVGLALLYANLGLEVSRKFWFPILFIAFAIPAPHSLIDMLTAPLKEFVSYLATSALKLFGMPITRQGVIIFVGQYQLFVEDACSGMNSLVGLTALSLLYTFLTRGLSWGYSIFITSLAIPVAIAANVVRVALIVVVTYCFGDAAAQGFIHLAAGIVLFSTSLLLIFAADRGARRVLSPTFRA